MRRRPPQVRGVTERVRTSHGNMYITINFDEQGKPFEVFTALGKAGSSDQAQLEGISRLVSMALRSGVAPDAIVAQLRGITDEPVWSEGTLVRSAPDALALALARAYGMEPGSPYGEQYALFAKESAAARHRAAPGPLRAGGGAGPGQLGPLPGVLWPGGLSGRLSHVPRVRLQQVRLAHIQHRQSRGRSHD